MFHRFALTSLFVGGAMATALAADVGRVTLVRTPNDGIQPQAAIDSSGTLHLIYYKGDPAEGDVWYVRRPATSADFSSPVRVNRQAGSAIAAGSIRGAQLALGKNGRAHVVWDGMGKGAKPVTFNQKQVAPLLYTRSDKDGTAFEPERNIITYAYGLDGGSSVAADPQGNVYVAWHGRAPQSGAGEAGRAIFVAQSQDEGATFAAEKPGVAQPTGACACCGMRAFADRNGTAYILFRAATENVERAETLLVSPKPGAEFQIAFRHPWKALTCPMSSAAISESKSGALFAWETGDNVYFASLNSKSMTVSLPTSPSAGTKRKHPVVAVNGANETILAWTEGTAWATGGSVAWQVYDADNRPTVEHGRADGVPAWSLVSAVAKPDGGFLLIY